MTLTKSVKLSKKGQFVIPREIRVALGVKEGDEILVTLEGKRAILTRPEHYAKASRGMLKGTWGETKQGVEDYIESERQTWR